MSKQKKFRLRGKPREPKRHKVKESYSLGEGDNLAGILAFFSDAQPEAVYFESERNYDDYYSDYCSFAPYFILERMQTDEEYAEDVAAYEKRLANYEKWYAENEQKIVAEVARREIEAEAKAEKDAEKAKKQIQKQQKVLEKNLAYLERRLQK